MVLAYPVNKYLLLYSKQFDHIDFLQFLVYKVKTIMNYEDRDLRVVFRGGGRIFENPLVKMSPTFQIKSSNNMLKGSLRTGDTATWSWDKKIDFISGFMGSGWTWYPTPNIEISTNRPHF